MAYHLVNQVAASGIAPGESGGMNISVYLGGRLAVAAEAAVSVEASPGSPPVAIRALLGGGLVAERLWIGV